MKMKKYGCRREAAPLVGGLHHLQLLHALKLHGAYDVANFHDKSYESEIHTYMHSNSFVPNRTMSNSSL